MNDNRYSGASEAELGFLKEIVRMLPAGLTVQDAQGELLLVNDVAAAQLGMDGSRPSPDLTPRREACQRALRSGEAVISEEALQDGAARQVLLTTHRPVRVAGRELLISASSDITEQKNFEDQLFRSAYFDELTGLPSRRVIEHRAGSLLARDGKGEREALAAVIAREQVVGAVFDHAPRGQSGQLVEIGRAEQLVLEILLLGDVGGGGDQELAPGEANGTMGREQHLARGAVMQRLLDDHGLAGPQRLTARFLALRQIGRGLAAVHAELGSRGIVNQEKLAMGVLHGQSGRQQFNDFLEKSEFGLCRAEMVVIAHGRHESTGSARLQCVRSCRIPS